MFYRLPVPLVMAMPVVSVNRLLLATANVAAPLLPGWETFCGYALPFVAVLPPMIEFWTVAVAVVANAKPPTNGPELPVIVV